MMPNRYRIIRLVGVAMISTLAGCTDSSPIRFGGLGRNGIEADPRPAAPLQIPNAPSIARPNPSDGTQQAKFIPEREISLRSLYQRAAQQHAMMESYIYRLKRREVVNGKKQPEELVKVQLRREPYSVHLVWLGKEGKGREAIFVKGKFKNEMQISLAASDVFGLGAGMRISVAPDDPKAKAKSRHPITETGFGPMIDAFGRLVACLEKGDPREGTAKLLGRVKRDEFAEEVIGVEQLLPPGSDPLLPRGGRRLWFFDTKSGLPTLYITYDADGEVEYYCHDCIIWPAPMDDNDFNPDRVWRKSS